MGLFHNDYVLVFGKEEWATILPTRCSVVPNLAVVHCEAHTVDCITYLPVNLFDLAFCRHPFDDDANQTAVVELQAHNFVPSRRDEPASALGILARNRQNSGFVGEEGKPVAEVLAPHFGHDGNDNLVGIQMPLLMNFAAGRSVILFAAVPKLQGHRIHCSTEPTSELRDRRFVLGLGLELARHGDLVCGLVRVQPGISFHGLKCTTFFGVNLQEAMHEVLSCFRHQVPTVGLLDAADDLLVHLGSEVLRRTDFKGPLTAKHSVKHHT
mmetsp:Transcript_21361/g.46376  ORF Transcript_21361/g.46376 Transcript_21361/m.46376 type:complete len:268 (-) Transcript_21361:1085-1888(-)